MCVFVEASVHDVLIARRLQVSEGSASSSSLSDRELEQKGRLLSIIPVASTD